MATKQVTPQSGGQQADAIAAQAANEEAQRSAFAAVVTKFAEFGATAGAGAQVTTTMALYFHDQCALGVVTFDDAEKLYKPYAEAYRVAAHDDTALTGNSYEAGKSTFATFGLLFSVAVQANPKVGKLYGRVKELRDGMSPKPSKSLYQCMVAVNRALSEACGKGGMGLDKLVATLGDAKSRDTWLLGIVGDPAEKDAAPKDDMSRVKRLQSDLERAAKKSARVTDANGKHTAIGAQFAAIAAAIETLRGLIAEADAADKAEADGRAGDLIKAAEMIRTGAGAAITLN